MGCIYALGQAIARVASFLPSALEFGTGRAITVRSNAHTNTDNRIPITRARSARPNIDPGPIPASDFQDDLDSKPRLEFRRPDPGGGCRVDDDLDLGIGGHGCP